jgi:hypothetical protein
MVRDMVRTCDSYRVKANCPLGYFRVPTITTPNNSTQTDANVAKRNVKQLEKAHLFFGLSSRKSCMSVVDVLNI